ncbi:PTS galactosamine/N-acetylgalactosamine transporter subunit IIA [Vibrio fluvialis]|uniref:PTS galactosamine/N-acetylgalactosamine transporter subunit IIA n=1 Tax=Vibrio fluvialis TaxID=676 RepID=UPI0005CA204E|nr:PTS galactosamine/N-acetylgalactosamine transporter subunit IIA [Vibrio fluvialis]
MIGIVVSGHIHFASGIESAVRAIAGEQQQMTYVDFVETMSTDDLEAELRRAANEVDTGEGVLFLADIPGGSPSNRILAILMDRPDVELIAGANLPMIANAAFEREGVSLQALVATLLEIGASCMQDMRKQLESIMAPESGTDSEDGL